MKEAEKGGGKLKTDTYTNNNHNNINSQICYFWVVSDLLLLLTMTIMVVAMMMTTTTTAIMMSITAYWRQKEKTRNDLAFDSSLSSEGKILNKLLL